MGGHDWGCDILNIAGARLERPGRRSCKREEYGAIDAREHHGSVDYCGTGGDMVSGGPCVLDAGYLGLYRTCDARLSSHSTLVSMERYGSGQVDMEVLELVDDVLISSSTFQRLQCLQAGGRGMGD